MRIVLFYSDEESFNFFTDRLAEEFQKRGHEIFILDLRNRQEAGPHSYKAFTAFASKKMDAAVCFDGLGTREDPMIELWDAHKAVVVDILMDHPLRFHSTLKKHPRRYLLFCCDRNHVNYVKEYFGADVPYVLFMPHAGVALKDGTGRIPYGKRKYGILFSGTYYQPESMLSQTKKFNNATVDEFYRLAYQNLLQNSRLTTEQAVLCTMEQLGWDLSGDVVKAFMEGAVYVDWAVRQYQREQVVRVLAESGLPLYLLGRGWENHPSVHCKNVHRLDDRIPYAGTLPIMADAKINLNVMPWFKDGTHDRIFNALLQHSVPLTDPSRWLEENFADGQEIAFYDLDHLEDLPVIAEKLLTDSELAEAIIQNGYEKAAKNLTWGHCAEWVLDGIGAVENRERQADSAEIFQDRPENIAEETQINQENSDPAVAEVIRWIRTLQETVYDPNRDNAKILSVCQSVLNIAKDKAAYVQNSEEMLKALEQNRLSEEIKQQWLVYAGSIYASFSAVKIYEDFMQKKIRLPLEEVEEMLEFYLKGGLSPELVSAGVYVCARQLEERDPMRCYELTKTAFSLYPDLAQTFGIEYRYEGQAAEEDLTETCPFCGSEGKNLVPYYCSPQVFKLNRRNTFPPAKLWMRCGHCGNYVTYNFPKRSVGIINGHYTKKQDDGILQSRFNLWVYNPIFNRLRQLSSGNDYLEIGVGTGEMLAVAREFGYHAEAVEICREDQERISAALGIEIVWSDILDYETEKQFDVIAMGDVLEHVTRPGDVLKKVRGMLKKDGVLWISTPNYNCAYARMEKFTHCMWHELNHYTYVSRETMEALLADLQMEIVHYDMSSRYIGSMELYIRHVGN